RLLESECHAAKVHIFLNTCITDVTRATEFVLRAESVEFDAPALVVATGGLSIPKMGATSFGYDLARQFRLKVQKTRPALVPLVFEAADCERYCDLAGVSAEVVAGFGGQRFRESMLITHRGLSGPAILQISSYWNNGKPVSIDLAPGREVTAALRDVGVRNIVAARAAFQGVLPKRFATRWL